MAEACIPCRIAGVETPPFHTWGALLAHLRLAHDQTENVDRRPNADPVAPPAASAAPRRSTSGRGRGRGRQRTCAAPAPGVVTPAPTAPLALIDRPRRCPDCNGLLLLTPAGDLVDDSPDRTRHTCRHARSTR